MSRFLTLFDSTALSYMSSACSEALQIYQKEIVEDDIGGLKDYTPYQRHELQERLYMLYNRRELIKWVGVIATVALAVYVSTLLAVVVTAATFFAYRAVRIKPLQDIQCRDYAMYTRLCFREAKLPLAYFRNGMIDKIEEDIKKLKASHPKEMADLYIGHLSEKFSDLFWLRHYLQCKDDDMFTAMAKPADHLQKWMKDGLGIAST